MKAIFNSELKIFMWPVRVYYQDTDAGGVVFHSTYLNFMERARVEWLRQLGFDNHDLTLTHRVIFMVRSITIDYLKPAHLDDLLHVTVETAEVGRSRVILAQQVVRGHAVLASARVGVVCVSLETFKPVSVPAAIRHRFADDCESSGQAPFPAPGRSAPAVIRHKLESKP